MYQVTNFYHASHSPTPNGALQSYRPILKIIDDTSLEIDLIVPSDWLSWLDKGTQFTFTVDETGKQYDGSIIRLNAAVDPVSQTIKIRAKFKSPPTGVLAGMSGFAKFAPPEG